MAIQRSILAGMTDYTGAELEDIIDELEYFISRTKQSLEELSNLEIDVQKNSDKFDFPNDIIDHIDEYNSKFNRYLLDLNRVRGEVGSSIENRHVETINNLYNNSQFDETSCRRFKNDNICRSLKDESVRPIVDKIYEVTMGIAVDYKDLSNMKACLERFVGTTFLKKESVIETADKIIELKPNFFGIGINLNYALKFFPNFCKKRLKTNKN